MTNTPRSGDPAIMRQLLAVLAIVSLVLGACGPGTGGESTAVITATELAQRIEAGSSPFVLDVRSPQEYAQGHIPGAVNIPYDVLPARVTELGVAKSEEIVVFCQVGGRAQVAESTLREVGFTNVRDLEGHWQAWQAAGLPSE